MLHLVEQLRGRQTRGRERPVHGGRESSEGRSVGSSGSAGLTLVAMERRGHTDADSKALTTLDGRSAPRTMNAHRHLALAKSANMQAATICSENTPPKRSFTQSQTRLSSPPFLPDWMPCPVRRPTVPTVPHRSMMQTKPSTRATPAGPWTSRTLSSQSHRANAYTAPPPRHYSGERHSGASSRCPIAAA